MPSSGSRCSKQLAIGPLLLEASTAYEARASCSTSHQIKKRMVFVGLYHYDAFLSLSSSTIFLKTKTANRSEFQFSHIIALLPSGFRCLSHRTSLSK